MQWKSANPSFFCFVLFALASAGCRPTPPNPEASASKHSGIELRIACPTEETAALIRSHTRSWALHNGATLLVERYDPANPSKEQRQAVPSADVWLISPADLPHEASSGRLLPLPESFRAPENPLAWSDFTPTYREQLTQWDGKIYGLPVVGEAPLCCYRADLVKAPAHQAALRGILGQDLAGPLTWEQFVQLAEYFRDKGVDGRPGPSLPPLPRAEADLDRLFYTLAAGFARRAIREDTKRRTYEDYDIFSFHYDFKTGQPRIAEPGFVHALKLLQRLQTCRPAEAVDHPEQVFAAGQAILCLTDAPWLKAFQKTPALRDKVGVCRVPGGGRYFDFQTGQERPPQFRGVNHVQYLGGAGWLAVVPRSSRNGEAAFDLLADLTGKKMSMQIYLGATGQGGPTRTGQLYQHRMDSFDLDEQRQTQLHTILEDTLLHRSLKNPALCLRTPHQAEHRAVLVRGLREALLKGADAEKTLQNVAEAWRKLDREQGLEEHRTDYRRSLGLLAKE